MILSTAQIKPFDNDFDKNLKSHEKFIIQAAAKKADLILFPEMSLTGYLRETAKEHAFKPNDKRLNALKTLARENNIIVIAGAPIEIQNNLCIGAFILHPDGKEEIYTKQYLHTGEEVHFQPSFNFNPAFEINNEALRMAICADIENENHPEAAHKAGTSIYLASIFYSVGGIDGGNNKLTTYAKKYNMTMLMSNFVGQSYGIESGGKSSFYDNSGKLIGRLDSKEVGLLIVEKHNDGWRLLNS